MQSILAHYLTEFEKFRTMHLFSKNNIENLQQRERAIEKFLTTGFPQFKEEQWRYSATSPLLQHPFYLLSDSNVFTSTVTLPPLDEKRYRLVFINGLFSPILSTDIQQLPHSVRFSSMRQPTLPIESTKQKSFDGEENAFTLLNRAFYQDGCILHIEANCTVAQPIELWYVTDHDMLQAPTLLPIKNIIHIGEHSHVELIEHSYQTTVLSSHLINSFVNHATQVTLAPYAHLTWSCALQLQECNSYVSQLSVRQEKHSILNAKTLVLSAAGLTRITMPVSLTGKGASFSFDGLNLAKSCQHIDYYLKLQHEAHNTVSQIHERACADDRSQIAFGGEVTVNSGVERVEAHQTSHNLLLSSNAIIRTRPRLELFTDSLVCTHGATIGAIDDLALCYLCTRGIPKKEAKNMLIYAFNQTALNRMPQLTATPFIKTALSAWFNFEIT